MKELILRAIAKAPFRYHCILSVALIIVSFGVTIPLGIVSWWVTLFCLIELFIISILVHATPTMLMNPTVKILNEQCDPYPLLKETETQLDYKIPKANMLVVQLNYAAALSYIGEHQKNFDYLSRICIDEYYVPINKFIYYHNLSSACDQLGDTVAASIWYQKALQIYDTIKQKKLTRMLDDLLPAFRAAELHRQNKNAEAMALLDTCQPSSLFGTVSNAFAYAQYASEAGDFLTARGKLRFVIENGNRLSIVEEANVLLEHCEREIQKRNEQLGKGDPL